MNKFLFFIMIQFLFFQHTVKAQKLDNNRQEYFLNKNLEGSEYRFSFVHITDVHIGEGYSDYGTYGFAKDTMPDMDNSKPTLSLIRAVQWINENYQAKNIKFVIVSGDLTGKAQHSEFEKFKSIMSTLEIPYIPMIGNHDVWQYVRYGFEEPYPTGDTVINTIFKNVFESAKNFFDNWNDGTRLTATFDPESGHEHYFQNFSFEYDGFKFYALDFNPRYHVKKEEPGIGPEAQLHDIPGGTFQWLKKELSLQPKHKENTILLAHHPLTDNLIYIIAGFVFEYDEYDKLTKMLIPYSNNLALYLAGHVHIYNDYQIRSLNKLYNIMPARVMPASKDFDSAYFQIIHVYKPQEDLTPIKINNINTNDVQIYPNPTSDILNIQLKMQIEDFSCTIFDNEGNLVLKAKPNKIDNLHYTLNIEQLTKGVYQLQISNENIIGNFKVIKQ
ncbi:MAG: metallophosphoesterase [Bacteroidetes bacterium]|nr:metallophosphoesterase [Bacteroidota bacterium]